jgi:hypothetical protein
VYNILVKSIEKYIKKKIKKKMPLEISDLLNFVYLIFNALRKGIQLILEKTIIKASPFLAEKYADAISILITITAVWLMLEFSSGLKKVVRFVVVLGWILLGVSIIIEVFF